MQKTSTQDNFDQVFGSSVYSKKTITQLQKNFSNNTISLRSTVIDISANKNQGNLWAGNLRTSGELEFDNLQIVKKIGKGGFSEVYQAHDEETGKEYALRLCKIDNVNFSFVRATKEININNTLKLINHPNITDIFSSKIIVSNLHNKDERSLQVVMELGICTLEDVFRKRQKENKPYSEVEVLKICEMLLSALNSASKYGVYHRDISLNNIVQSNDLKNYKFIDFGEAQMVTDRTENLALVGKFSYMAPEIREIFKQIDEGTFKKKPGESLYNTEKADVFSLGLCIGSITSLEKFDGREVGEEDHKKRMEKIRERYPRIHLLLCDMIQVRSEPRKKTGELLAQLSQYKELDKFEFFEMEFESGLNFVTKKTNSDSLNGTKQSFGSFEDTTAAKLNHLVDKDCLDFYRKGELNMKNNLFGQAILNFLKAYEILKRNNPNANKMGFFEYIIQISINICYCQKQLLNYDEAANILKTCLDNLRKRVDKEPKLKPWYIHICNEYAELLILKYNFEEATDIIGEGLKYIDTGKNKTVEEVAIFANLITLKAEILFQLGFFDNARKLFESIKKIITTQFPASLKSVDQGMSGQELNCNLLLLSCEQYIARILCFNSKFTEAEKIFDRLTNEYKNIFNVEDNEYTASVLIDQLKMSRYYQDFAKREELVNKLATIYSTFDHFRLMKSNDFMEFVYEKVLHLLDLNKVEDASIRCKNILELLKKTSSMFWYTQFRQLYCMCIRKSPRKSQESMTIQKEIYAESKEREKRLKNYRLFIDVHIEMNHNYFDKGEYEKALKCLKFINIEYYDNKDIIKSEREQLNNTGIAYIYLCEGTIYRKLSQFDKSLRYFRKCEEILKIVFKDREHRNMIFARLYKSFGKLYYDMADYLKARGYYEQTKNIYNYLEKNFGIGGDGMIYLYKEMGNVAAKMDSFNDALQFYRKSIQMADEILPTINNTGYSATLNDLANLCASFDKYDLAMEYYQKAVKINQTVIKDLGEKDSLELSTNYHGIGNVYMKQNKFDKALDYYRMSKEMSSRCLKGDKNAEVAKTLFQIAYVYKKKGCQNDAYLIYDECQCTFMSIFNNDKGNYFVKKTTEEMGNLKSMMNREEIDKIVKENN